MKRLLNTTSILAVATFFASPALAADIYKGGSTKDAPVAGTSDKPINWSGIIVGGAIGYGVVNHELDGSGFNFDGISSDGFHGCGIVGAQIQRGVFVVGAEGRGCLENVSTEIAFGSSKGSLDLNDSYAAYGKLGYAHGSWLFSALGGYKWQHYKVTGGDSDTIGGISGGLTAELALDDAGHLVIGPELFVTKFNDQDISSGVVDKPLLFEGGLRLTYRFGY